MMLGDEDGVLCAGCFGGFHPLVGVDVGGMEDGGIGGAVAPLAVQESVGSEVDDDADLEVLPLDLRWAWLDVHEVLAVSWSGGGEGQKREGARAQQIFFEHSRFQDSGLAGFCCRVLLLSRASRRLGICRWYPSPYLKVIKSSK